MIKIVHCLLLHISICTIKNHSWNWRILTTIKSDVAAPIDLPHRPIVLTRLSFLTYSTIIFRSSFSNQPREINSLSESPHPAKSKQNKVIFYGNKYFIAFSASNRLDLFPCKYITQGNSSQNLQESCGSKWEH